MLTALARKELRELAPLVALVVLAQLYLVSVGVGLPMGPRIVPGNRIPFLDDSLAFWLILAGGSAGAVFGFWQTQGESVRGTWQFLLHRPAPREAILGAKVLIGAGVTLAVTALPILFYALWAATPGTHPSPFEWRFTLESWIDCLQVPLVYFAAYLSGLRPARWFGSRLFPLAFGLAIVLLVRAFYPWWWIVVPVTLAVEAAFVLIILDVGAQRDFS